jgi:hypothetical protein
MQFIDRSVFGALTAKLLGTYEKELQDTFRTLVTKRFGLLINVGAAEGYYAVGLARNFPNVPVVAFEMLEDGRNIISTLANYNGVNDRIDIQGVCSSRMLSRFLRPRASNFLLMDVEGAELEILSPEVIGLLGDSHVIVESHDFEVPECTEQLLARFKGSHSVCVIESRQRCLSDFPLRLTLPRSTKLSLMDERRPALRGPMKWLVMEPTKS